jgi:hypothetical protein
MMTGAMITASSVALPVSAAPGPLPRHSLIVVIQA